MPLADPGADALGGKAFDIRREPMQVTLDHRSDVVAVGPQPLDEVQRALGVGRSLHVDPDEDAMAVTGIHDRGDYRQALLIAQIQPHAGQLDAAVNVEALGGDALDGRDVRRRGSVDEARSSTDSPSTSSVAPPRLHPGRRAVDTARRHGRRP